MNNNILTLQKTTRLTCAWVPTGNPRNPLACVWVDTNHKTIAKLHPPRMMNWGGCDCAPSGLEHEKKNAVSAERREPMSSQHRSHRVPRQPQWQKHLLTSLMVFGPGLIVMVADNDGGAVSTYIQAGGQDGLHLLWTLVVLLPICYFVQEMVARLGIASGKGHAAMMYTRFGNGGGVSPSSTY